MTFGVLTLATSSDHRKAIALALSVRVSNPGVPIAVACLPQVRPLVTPYFDYVTDQDSSLRGYEHKIHLDRYSPFEETFFFDSDVLVFREIAAELHGWRGQPFTACGNYVMGGASPFGLDRSKTLKIIGADKLVHIDGAGHYYFRKPECHTVFDLARSVAGNLREYAVNPDELKFADEDVIDIAMTIMNLKPIPHGEFWSRYCTARRGTVVMNAAEGICRFESATSGKIQFPLMMHFAAREAPFVYARQLRQLFKKFGVRTRGLLRLAIEDYYVSEVKWPLKKNVRRLLARLGLLGFLKRKGLSTKPVG
jgi:hypothetical protein